MPAQVQVVEMSGEGNSGAPASRERRLAIAVIGALSLVFLAFAAIRAVRLSITYDEAVSYLFFAEARHFFLPSHLYRPFGANHHPLNTWGMILFSDLWGPREWALRLPALLGQVVYLYATARIALRFTPLLAVLAFVLLNAQLYVLDFFSLARGYSPAMGWTMMALFLLTQCAGDELAPRRVLNCLGAAALATLSNLTFLNVFVALLACLLLLVVRAERSAPRRPLMVALAVPTVLVFAWAIPQAWWLRQAGSFYYGGTTGFLHDVAGSLARDLAYDQQPAALLVRVFQATLLLVPLLASLLALLEARERRPRSNLGLMLLLLVLVCAEAEVQHLVLGLPYPTDRTALLFLPLLLVLGVEVCHALSVRWPRAGLATTAAACLAVVSFAAAGATLDSVHEWRTGADAKEILRVIVSRRSPEPATRRVAQVFVDYDSAMPLRFYQETQQLGWLNIGMRRDIMIRPDADFYYLTSAGEANPDPARLRLVAAFPRSGHRLFQGVLAP